MNCLIGREDSDDLCTAEEWSTRFTARCVIMRIFVQRIVVDVVKRRFIFSYVFVCIVCAWLKTKLAAMFPFDVAGCSRLV